MRKRLRLAEEDAVGGDGPIKSDNEGDDDDGGADECEREGEDDSEDEKMGRRIRTFPRQSWMSIRMIGPYYMA